jgi:hypothetical protein
LEFLRTQGHAIRVRINRSARFELNIGLESNERVHHRFAMLNLAIKTRAKPTRADSAT